MIFVYNFLQAVLLIIAFPVILLIVLGKGKYRSRIGDRLGFGLDGKINSMNRSNRKLIWIHSLSVGEVTSAIPLVKGIREEMDQVCMVFSASTDTGMNIAQEKIKPYVDLVIASPLDLFPVIKRFVRLIRPDMFILVETDFWPNWLHYLRQEDIPLVLVNGRISRSSFKKYQRFVLFFNRLFRSFSLLAMQTENDAMQMRRLEVPAEQIKTLGNLKYDTNLFIDNRAQKITARSDLRIPDDSRVWVCGSTHAGEEELIISAFANLCKTRKDCFLLLAPRDPGRSGEIQEIITARGLRSMRRTCPEDPAAQILILDTIGELVDCYPLALAAFIGGSLVDLGGHNPLEASAHGVPCFFGPHMDDFLEIAHDLTQCGGALTVDSASMLEQSVGQVFDDKSVHQHMSDAALDLVQRNTGVIRQHIREISSLLSKHI